MLVLAIRQCYTQSNMKHTNKNYILPISLCFLGGALLSCQASALTDSDELTARTTIEPYLAIEVGVDRGGNFDKILDLGTITPTDTGTFASDKLVTRVYTNSAEGYQLKLQDEDTDNAMLHANASVVSKISALNAVVSGVDNLGAGFPTNSWGYALGEFSGAGSKLDFAGVPTTAEAAATLAQTNTLLPDGYEDTTTTFGVKADLILVAGTYEDKVVFTASINLDDPEPDTPEKEAFYTITKMQEMTPAVCASVATPAASDTDVPKTTLIDERDGKSYTVRKLADGNCWMGGYMTYNLKPDDTFTPADTDVQSNWTAASAGVAIVGNVTSGEWPDDNGLRYYGQARGNLYNWNAATLGSAKGIGTGTASASICPAGWHIPTQPTFQNLFGAAYGMAAKHGDDDFGTFFGNEQPDNADVALIKNVIGLTPTDYWTGTGLETGANTDTTMLWTSTMGGMLGDGPLSVLFQPHNSIEAAHMLSTDNPATTDTAYADGYAVRCVAK